MGGVTWRVAGGLSGRRRAPGGERATCPPPTPSQPRLRLMPGQPVLQAGRLPQQVLARRLQAFRVGLGVGQRCARRLGCRRCLFFARNLARHARRRLHRADNLFLKLGRW